MKQKLTLFSMVSAALLLFSCNKDEAPAPQEEPSAGTPAAFTTQITRASGTAWDADDEIGIYMKTAGAILSTTSVQAGNMKHTTPGDGRFSFASPENTIYFPADGSNVDFIAYYPYTTTITDYKYPVELGGNQAGRLPRIDLMYSNNLVNKNKDSEDLTLGFNHQLALLELKITDQGGKSLMGMAVTITGMKTKSSFSLIDGTFTDDPASVRDIIAQTSVHNTLATAEALILPVTGLTGAKVTFNVPSHGKTYTWDIPANQEYKSGNQYSYEIEILSDGLKVLNSKSTIAGWINNPSGTVKVGEEGEQGGLGTQSSPYIVSQLAGKVNEAGKWVTGYIVGSTAKTRAFGTPSTENILIAATATESDEANCIPVDISASAVKANLDIVANPSLIGKPIKIQGDIVDNIFSYTLSLTNITAQEGGATPHP